MKHKLDAIIDELLEFGQTQKLMTGDGSLLEAVTKLVTWQHEFEDRAEKILKKKEEQWTRNDTPTSSC